MIDEIIRKIKKTVTPRKPYLDPDEIFLDSSNLASHDQYQFEGRIEKPIRERNTVFLGVVFLLIVSGFIFKIFLLQVEQGKTFADKSLNNHLKHEVVFAHRGTILDRNGKELAWSEISGETPFPLRKYTDLLGFGNLLGYVKYPKKDSSGNFYTLQTSGEDGLEKYFNELLSGVNGVKLTEVDVKGNTESQSILEPPENGGKVTLSIDSGIQDQMYRSLEHAVIDSGYQGGAGVLMNSKTGEVIALATYPEYNSSILTEGKDSEAISNFFNSSKKPFLDRSISGLYAPGSIVKPFIAVGVLNEKIIDPYKSILSTGSISLPNPYDPEHPSVFKDWKAHGYVDLRHAIAVSSDVYFYAVGGGFEGQKGLGITKIDEYLKKFQFTLPTEGFFAGPGGTIPSPQWKAENFNGDDWRVGDTYHTTIGQYGFQATPLQITRAMTGIANKGKVVSPTILKGDQGKVENISGVDTANFTPVQEGMRLAVTEATARALNISGVQVAAKTGTAEIGSGKTYVNSWVSGFFPYDNPEYTFTVVLEKGPVAYSVSAMQTMGRVVTWIRDNKPEYVGGVAKVLEEANKSPEEGNVSTSGEEIPRGN